MRFTPSLLLYPFGFHHLPPSPESLSDPSTSETGDNTGYGDSANKTLKRIMNKVKSPFEVQQDLTNSFVSAAAKYANPATPDAKTQEIIEHVKAHARDSKLTPAELLAQAIRTAKKNSR